MLRRTFLRGGAAALLADTASALPLHVAADNFDDTISALAPLFLTGSIKGRSRRITILVGGHGPHPLRRIISNHGVGLIIYLCMLSGIYGQTSPSPITRNLAKLVSGHRRSFCGWTGLGRM